MNKFGKYLKKLEKLDNSKTFLKSDRIVLLLSGSSNYETSALSDVQKNFLEIFRKYGYEIIKSNFPYNNDFEHENFEDVSILKASISNIIYYLHTLYNKRFRKEIKRHFLPLSEFNDIIIVTQSSGLNLLKVALESWDISNRKVKIFALGAFSYGHRKIQNCVIFKGKKDVYANFMDFHKCDIKVDCGHFDYLKNEQVKEIIYEWLEKNKN
ncbi:hypothetical protein [Leptotrichia sp. OH3620_COT-345]|uniref:hypothetical protein n=1 Tax=Leptotrichia sp. OH3620_COT-345 TaxID=2491048 RepID=UPI0013154392|nr:hypothetical protein [Leptotrichia sp. OH3620_COT-345]